MTIIDYSEFSWIIAVGIIVGLSFAMMIILKGTFQTFFIFMLIFSGFCYYGSLIELWIVILLVIVNSIILLLNLNTNSGLIMSTLTIMFILVIFNIIFGGTFVGTTETMLIDTDVLVDGVSSTFQAESEIFLFEIDSLEGMIIILTTIITIATFTGIQVLGSGLSDSSVRTIVIIAIFSGIWIILSILIKDLIWSIEIFGTLMYVLLTVVYSIGVVQKVIGN